MGGYAGADLAMVVSKAGGLGQIGAVDDVNSLRKQLQQVKEADCLDKIGVGLLLFVLEKKEDQVMELLEEYPPAVVWLFAANSTFDYVVWAKQIKDFTGGRSKIWIQVNSMAAAKEVSEVADAIVLQGIDAGGHGWEQGASIVSLLPEYDLDVPVLASGGIVNGKGVAAALALGADGVVMGTRFLASEEVLCSYKETVVATKDGGQSTVRAKVFDELKGPNMWPGLYDGRSVKTEAWKSYTEEGVEGARKAFKDGKTGVMWMGTGVGSVKKVQPASEIIEEVQREAREVIKSLNAKL